MKFCQKLMIKFLIMYIFYLFNTLFQTNKFKEDLFGTVLLQYIATKRGIVFFHDIHIFFCIINQYLQNDIKNVLSKLILPLLPANNSNTYLIIYKLILDFLTSPRRTIPPSFLRSIPPTPSSQLFPQLAIIFEAVHIFD